MPEQHDRLQPGPGGHRTVIQRARCNRRSLELTALVIVLFLIDLFWSSHTANTAAAGRAQIQAQAISAEQKAITAEQKAITAACDFWYPLTGLPVTVNAATGKPTKLSVQIIAGAREGYAGQCENDGKPPMPAPDPTLVRWAGFYHLPVAG